MRPLIHSANLLLGALFALGGCAIEDRTIHSGDYACKSDSDCSWGWKCLATGPGQKRCFAPSTKPFDASLADGPAPDAGPLTPDSFVSPDGWPATCKGQSPTAVTVRQSKDGDYALALDPILTYQAVTIAQAPAKAAVACFDYSVNWHQLAGFVVSFASSQSDPRQAAESAVAAAKAVTGKTTYAVRSKGDVMKTHDGFDAQVGQTWQVNAAPATSVGVLRNKLLAAFLGLDATRLTNVPQAFGLSGDTFLLSMATVVRKDGRVLLIGSLVPEAESRDPLKRSDSLTQGLADATWLARYGAKLNGNPDCKVHRPGQVPDNKVDVIMVMDESGSMAAKRKALANESALLFGHARRLGIDFRVGVTGVCDPKGKYAAVGRFCSVASSQTTHSGGTDRFLLPSEQATLASCLYNPPGYEGGSEYGLTNIKAAVTQHLPRAPNDPAKIRTGAKLMVVVATDEPSSEILSVVGYQGQNCTLSSTNQSALDAMIKRDYLDLLDGTKKPQAKVDKFFYLGGLCKSVGVCGAQVGHGYLQLVKALGGKAFDVCTQDLAENLKAELRELGIGNATVKLGATPVSSTLAVSVDGKLLPRDSSNQFHHDAKYNTVRFDVAVSITKGSSIVVTYRRWK